MRLLAILHDCWVSVIFMMTLVLFSVWIVGFFANGFFDFKFELESCWAGIGAISAAAATGWGKWVVDSTKNSDFGIMPNQEGICCEKNNAERHPENG